MGRKRPIVTDVLGLTLFCTISSANTADIVPARDFVKKIEEIDRVKKILLDKGYRGLEKETSKVEVEITSKNPEVKGFVPLHKRWIVERTFAWLNRQRRLCRDYEYDTSNQQSMVYIGMIKIRLK